MVATTSVGRTDMQVLRSRNAPQLHTWFSWRTLGDGPVGRSPAGV